MRFRQHAAAAATALTVLGGALATAPAAHAAGGTAPACIARVVDEMPDGQHVWLQNNCGRTMHVKVIVDGWYDSSCLRLADRATRELVLKVGTYHKTVVC
ncbi:hypothetical protein ACFV1L_19555 [Kitasatospora sp. NPDC059646]|uniref:hypothetical protein n=1 Tax=Kitasatospora sp. NPDC059646 TaxID=3346893 RepID=UPI0036CE74CF